MPTYSCFICGFYTPIKCKYNNHLQTNKHKKNINSVNSVNNINTNINNDTNVILCNLCNQPFSTKNSMYRHRKHRCPMNKDVIKQKQLDNLKKELKRLKNFNNNDKEYIKLQNECEKLKKEKDELYNYNKEVLDICNNKDATTTIKDLNTYNINLKSKIYKLEYNVKYLTNQNEYYKKKYEESCIIIEELKRKLNKR